MRYPEPEESMTRRAGFTLIELMASMAILLVIVLILISAFNSASNVSELNQRRIELNQTVRAVLDQISRDIQRAGRLNNVVSMYLDSGGYLIPGIVPTNTLFMLCDIQPPEPNPYGSLVNIGYQVTSTTVGGIQKYVLERGDDPGVITTGPCVNSWWNRLPSCTTPSTDPYWKLFSDNVIGVEFYFYTNTVNIVGDGSFAPGTFVRSWNSTDLPTSVGVWLYTIDSRSYERALAIDPTLGNSASVSIITNNMQRYFTRIFVPRGTQNQ